MGPNTDSGNIKFLPAFLKDSIAIAAVAAALTLLPAAARPASAADPAPSKADQVCLGCHGAAGMEKKLDGRGYVNCIFRPAPYLQSVHGANGCTSCHADVDPAKHPPEKNDIASKRSFSMSMTQVCRTCHTDKFDQWDTSIHAALVRAGNPAAPVCTDCHNPHAVDQEARRARSIRFPARNAMPTSTPPISAACTRNPGSAPKTATHRSAPAATPRIRVKSVSAGPLAQGPEAACFGCHADVLEKHQEWLPTPRFISKRSPARPAMRPTRTAKSTSC